MFVVGRVGMGVLLGVPSACYERNFTLGIGLFAALFVTRVTHSPGL
jgi:hypothetical protein